MFLKSEDFFLKFFIKKRNTIGPNPKLELEPHWSRTREKKVEHQPKFRLHKTTLYTRVSQYVPNFQFFNVFILKNKLIYIQKSRNKQIFTDPCKICERKLKTVRIFAQGPVQKRLKIESQFFAEMLFGPNTSIKYLMFTLIKIQFLWY